MQLNRDQAHQFALMLSCGVPAREAVPYFFDEDVELDTSRVAEIATRWQRSKLVREELAKLSGGEWTGLTQKQRIDKALEKTYNEMAYFLFTTNWAEQTNPGILAKCTQARTALELKAAGLAGSMNAIARFWDDLASGKVRPTPMLAHA
jgi:hypothetical protein